MNRKIAFISEHASPLATLGGVDSGGQNVYVGQLAKHLGYLGYTVDIFTRWDNPSLPQIVQWDKGVRVIHVTAGPKKYIKKENLFSYMSMFTKNMLPFVEKEKYKLIHANFWMSAYVAKKIKDTTGIPFVVTFHALGKIRKKFQGKADKFPQRRLEIEDVIVKEANHIIAECPQDREDLLYYYNANQDTISIIPCGFDPHEFYPIDKSLARMTLGLPLNQRIILQLGRIVPRKGIDTVIRSLKIINTQIDSPVSLLVVGGESDIPNEEKTPEIAHLQKVAKMEHVEDQVIFTGRRGRDQLKYYYNAADVFVTTPWYEPFGITPLEAMACGVPVVGTNVGGIKFSVLHGKTGFLCETNDVSMVADRVMELLNNDKLYKHFSENAKSRVNAFFTWSTVAHSLSNLYEKLLLHKYSSKESYEKDTAIIDTNFEMLSKTIRTSQTLLRIPILDASRIITQCLTEGGKILLCGNGGSATDAQHFATELVGHFQKDNRPGLPVLSLTSESAIITAVANDFSYSDVFARQIESYGDSGDVVIGLSTSGNSENVYRAFQKAREKGLICIGLLGSSGGKCINLCDIAIVVPSTDTQRIQEVHGNVIHTLSEIIEKKLFTSDTPNLGQKTVGSKNGKSFQNRQQRKEAYADSSK